MTQHAPVTRVIHAPHLSKLSAQDRAKIYAEAKPEPIDPLETMGAMKFGPQKVSLTMKARRLFNELKAWNKAGRPMASSILRRARLKACNACKFYNKTGNLFLGECTAPGCGCTRAKAFILTSKCPFPGGSKWPDSKL